MKDYIKEIVDEKFSLQDNRNRIREYIQKFLLYILYKKKLYKDLVFVGGTALRFLYQIKRFSENLDFSLSYKAKECDFKNILKTKEMNRVKPLDQVTEVRIIDSASEKWCK